MKTLALASQKGGPGKSTAAINLAGIYAVDQRVLLVDFDPQGNATTGLNYINPDNTISDVFAGRAAAQDVIIHTGHGRLDLLPAGASLAGLESEKFSEERLKNVLADLVDYDLIIIDTPPHLGRLTLMAMAAADRLLVPVLPGLYSYTGFINLYELVEEIRERGLNSDLAIVGMFFNQANPRTNVYQTVELTLRANFGPYLMKTMIPPAVIVAEAQLVGKPLSVYAPKHRATKAYCDLSKEVMRRWQKRS